MICPDANLLIFSYDPVSPFHLRARKWLEELLSSSEAVGVPNLSVYAFLRYVTNPTRLKRPLRFAEAADLVNTWLALPNVRILYPGDRHWLLFQQICAPVRLAGNVLTDAAIAALAIEYGGIVHTHDRDFARFPGLRWHNPLA